MDFRRHDPKDFTLCCDRIEIRPHYLPENLNQTMFEIVDTDSEFRELLGRHLFIMPLVRAALADEAAKEALFALVDAIIKTGMEFGAEDAKEGIRTALGM